MEIPAMLILGACLYPAWNDKIFVYGEFRIISTSIMKIRRIASENSWANREIQDGRQNGRQDGHNHNYDKT